MNLEREPSADDRIWQFGQFALNLRFGALYRGEERRELQPKVFEALRIFVERPGSLITREDLMTALWPDVVVGDESLSQLIKKLRRALDDDPRTPMFIETVPRRGYRFLAPVTWLDSQVPTAQFSKEAPNVAATDHSAATMPRSTTSLYVGRAAERARVEALLREPSPFVTLVGAGGMGKTRLAKEALASLWHGPSLWVDLSEVHDATGIVREVGLGLGAPFTQATYQEAAVRIGAALKALGRTLLVLDNVEQVIEPVRDLVSQWRRLAPDAGLLATSREKLGHNDEFVVAIGPMEPYDAAALFRLRAAASKGVPHDWDGEAETIGTLVEHLDCNPLAIELAASRASLLTVRELQERLNQRFRMLTAGRGERPARHSSLRAAIEWSWERLELWEQDALAQLSVIPGGCTVGIAEQLLDLTSHPDAPWSLDVVQALRDKSLIEASGVAEPHRSLRLLESVRLFAHEQLAARGALDTTRARFSDIALAHAEPLAECAGRQPSTKTLAELSGLLDTLIAIVNWSGAGYSQRTARAALAASAALSRLGPFPLLRQLLQRALEQRGDLNAALVAELLVVRAEAVVVVRAPGAHAVAEVDEAIEAAERAGAEALVARAMTAKAQALSRDGHVEESIAAAERAVACAEGAAAWAPAVAGATALVRALSAHGELGRARTVGERFASQALAMDLPERWAEMKCALAYAESVGGDRGETERHYADALGVYQRLGLTWREAVVRANLAVVSAGAGRREHTLQQYHRAIELLCRLGDWTSEAGVQVNLSAFCTWTGAYEQAEQAAERALALAVAHELGRFRTLALLNLGTAAWMRERFDTARRRYREAIALAVDAGSDIDEARARGWLAAALADEGDAIEATAELARAQAIVPPQAVASEAHFWRAIEGLIAAAEGRDIEARAALEAPLPQDESRSKVELLRTRLQRWYPVELRSG